MKQIKYTLITDGSSDQLLLHVINWLLNDLYPTIVIDGKYADFSGLPDPPKKKEVADQIKYAVQYYPYDILFYHRDAEKNEKDILENRKNEIFGALNDDNKAKTICVVPIVMMETWLMIDEAAIKKAAGNRNYNDKIQLPAVKDLEKQKDPKQALYEILRQVSGCKGRRLDNFNVRGAVHQLAENIQDYSALRNLSAFIAFENDVKAIMKQNGLHIKS
jgi:hypothetical protein